MTYPGYTLQEWQKIHPDFAEKGYQDKTYQQYWEAKGLTNQDAHEWVNDGFQPKDYQAVQNWKKQGFTSQQAKKWIKSGLETDESKWASLAKNQGLTSQQFANKLQGKRDVSQWINFFYPKKKRSEITELYISAKWFTGSLELDGFVNLKGLILSFRFLNQLTNLNFLPLIEERLEELAIHNNNFSPSTDPTTTIFIDLTIFSRFINLEKLEINNNPFTGSLQPLQNLTKLKKLDISGTDIDSGLEYLPESLEDFYCKWKLDRKLKVYGEPDSDNCIQLLQNWRKDHQEKIELAKDLKLVDSLQNQLVNKEIENRRLREEIDKLNFQLNDWNTVITRRNSLLSITSIASDATITQITAKISQKQEQLLTLNEEEKTYSKREIAYLGKLAKKENTLSSLKEKNIQLVEKCNLYLNLIKLYRERQKAVESLRKQLKTENYDNDQLMDEILSIQKECVGLETQLEYIIQEEQLTEKDLLQNIEGLEKLARNIIINVNSSITTHGGHTIIGSTIGNNNSFGINTTNYGIEEITGQFQAHTLQPPQT